ncbi:uncharacterized protein [Nicotiana tomentosiformis]|uniref:uncharacterized protein n=1 Tax=Nicotiana tomentosiformis TaxID=4098 RepID=UPI00388CE1AB
MAPKLEDPGAFTIPCTIGSAEFAKVLCDLRQVKFDSLFDFQDFRYWATNTMRLQMADHTMKMSLGVIEDVLVWVDKFILPADFVILDCEVDYKVPIIIGIYFLATGKALCDVESGKLNFRVGDEKVIFHVCKSMRQPNNNEM